MNASKDWEIATGKDHTTGSETGGFIRMWSRQEDPAIAVIKSPIIPPGKEVCFDFWYKMYGDEVGKIQVMLRSNDSYVIEPIILWTREGSQGPGWLHAVVNVNEPIPNQIAIQGVGAGINSPIAIDDINVNSGSCPPQPVCGFEDGFCDWQQVATDDINWKRGTYMMTSSSGVTPEYDHTMGTNVGYFLYVDPRKSEGKIALLESASSFTPFKSMCMKMWYFTQGFNGFIQVVKTILILAQFGISTS